MGHKKDKLVKILWLPAGFGLLFLAVWFNVFTSLDHGAKTESSDVIIVAEGSVPERAYRGVELLLKGYSASDKLIVSPATKTNLPFYLSAGADRKQLILEEEATSTWTNATNTIDIMEENGWDSAIVVTTDYHTRRTRLSFERASKGKDMEFTYVSAYQEVNGQPTRYLEHEAGRKSGLREAVKYFGYLFGLYYVFDF